MRCWKTVNSIVSRFNPGLGTVGLQPSAMDTNNNWPGGLVDVLQVLNLLMSNASVPLKSGRSLK